MDHAKNAMHINQVAPVFVPVADQERALAFYLEKFGFEKRADFIYGTGARWLEVAPARRSECHCTGSAKRR
jgi:predicted enzyme related to lactoylglutathione lyase